MLGELIGLGLVALAARLAGTKSNEDFWEDFRDGHLALHTIWRDLWDPEDVLYDEQYDQYDEAWRKQMAYTGIRPCTLKKRRALDSFKWVLDDLRKKVLRHPDFPRADLEVGCFHIGSKKRGWKLDPEVDDLGGCKGDVARRRIEVDDIIRDFLSYEKQLKAECSFFWTPDQGLEGMRFRRAR
jgi:hypothetical protein